MSASKLASGDKFTILKQKFEELRLLTCYAAKDSVVQLDGYQLNIIQLQGHGILFNDDVFLAVPATEEIRVIKGEKRSVKHIRFLNISNFARIIAEYKNALTFIVVDI